MRSTILRSDRAWEGAKGGSVPGPSRDDCRRKRGRGRRAMGRGGAGAVRDPGPVGDIRAHCRRLFAPEPSAPLEPPPVPTASWGLVGPPSYASQKLAVRGFTGRRMWEGFRDGGTRTEGPYRAVVLASPGACQRGRFRDSSAGSDLLLPDGVWVSCPIHSHWISRRARGRPAPISPPGDPCYSAACAAAPPRSPTASWWQMR